jgi:hypothetical protein
LSHSSTSPFYFFTLPICLAKNSSTIMNKSVESEHPCLVHDCRGNVFIFSTFSIRPAYCSFVFTKNSSFCWLYIVCLDCIEFSPQFFTISFHLLILGLACSCFSKNWRCIFVLDLIWFFNVGTQSYKISFLELPSLYPKGFVKLCFHFYLIMEF